MSENKIEEFYTITELLYERDETYSQYTASAMALIGNVLEAAESMIDNPTDEEIRWQAVELGEKDTIIIIGSLTFPIGAMVETDDPVPVLIDEDNQEALKKILRIGIGVDLAMNGTVEEIKDFFLERNEELSMGELKERLKEAREQEEFDTETLTEEQKEKLRLFTRMNNEELN